MRGLYEHIQRLFERLASTIQNLLRLRIVCVAFRVQFVTACAEIFPWQEFCYICEEGSDKRGYIGRCEAQLTGGRFCVDGLAAERDKNTLENDDTVCIVCPWASIVAGNVIRMRCIDRCSMP
jgi:hypothetical protein